jgi:hypothetical protein
MKGAFSTFSLVYHTHDILEIMKKKSILSMKEIYIDLNYFVLCILRSLNTGLVAGGEIHDVRKVEIGR